MLVLVVNAGSSSLKVRILETSRERAASGTERVRARGLVEHFGAAASVRLRIDEQPAQDEQAPLADHAAALDHLFARLRSAGAAALADGIGAVGHRIVHGGERFTASARIDAEVLAAIEACSPLAPLHNPVNLAGLRAAMQLFPSAVQVAVFDTAFHQTMPPAAYVYALPHAYYERHGIRRYGFHGTSHRYVTQRAAAFLDRDPADPTLRLVSCHLGNGCSVAAVAGGVSRDTSMGFTPTEGLVMGTRSGDVDPAALLRIMELEGLDVAAADTLVNKKSGLLGLSGRSHDMRALLEAEAEGDARARLAIDVFCHRVRKYIGAYAAVLGGATAVIFTGGIGENAAPVRQRILAGLGGFGLVLDEAANAAPATDPRRVSAPGSPIEALVVPTDEELVIARDTFALV